MLNWGYCMIRLKNKIRELLLRLILPKEQFYIQGDGEFHSVFQPIFKPLLDRSVAIDEGDEDNNGK